MKCPPGLAPILLGMIRMGILYIRSSAWSGDAERCATEADHIHNLPDLIDAYTDERLAYYWNVERPLYAARVGRDTPAAWESLWEELRPFAERVGGASAATSLPSSAPR